MKSSISSRIARRKQKNLKRFYDASRHRFFRRIQPRKVIWNSNIKYELADRTNAINHGPIIATIKLAQHH